MEAISKNVRHEPLEVCLVEKAVAHLLDPNTKSKTVLVDIFARHTAKCIKLETNSKGQTVLETHTIVLFKSLLANGKYDILIIDPNNFAYSSHIANMKLSLSNGANFNDFSALHSKEMQIYKDAGKKGPKPDEYRDCTDVAVKIAFNLDASPEKSINIKKIKDLEEIKRISNQDEIDKFIFLTPAKVLPSDPKNSIVTIRMKQSSNVTDSEVYYKFQQMIDGGNKLLKATGKHPDEILKYLRPKFLTIISTQEKHSVTLKSLLDFAFEYKKHVADECLDTCEKIFEDIPNLLGQINP